MLPEDEAHHCAGSRKVGRIGLAMAYRGYRIEMDLAILRVGAQKEMIE